MVNPEPLQRVMDLQQQLQQANHDTTRIQLFRQLSTAYLATNNYDSAFGSIQHGLQLAIKGKRSLDLGRMYWALGRYYNYRRISPQNIDAVTKSVHFFQQSGRIDEASEAMYYLAQMYVGESMYDKGIEQINRNLAYSRQTGYYKRVCSQYCLLYELHKSLGQKKRVLEDLQAMKKAARDYHYPIDLYLANTNLAEWYEAETNYTKAIAYYKATIPITEQLAKPDYFVAVFIGIAANLIHLKRLEEAELYLNKAFQEAKKDKLMIVASVYITLARLKEQQNRLPEAYQAALIAVNYARAKHPYLALDFLKTLLSIQEKQGHYQESLATLHELYALNDSLKEVKNIEAIEMAESRFALDKKEQDITLLNKNVAIQDLELEQTYQQQVIYVLTTVGLLIILLLLGWFGWQTRKNLRKLKGQQAQITTQSERLQELNSLKDKLFLLIGHDFRSPLMHLRSSLAQLDMAQRTTDRFTHQIDRLKRTADSLYNTMDNLLHWAALQRTGVITKPTEAELPILITEAIEFLDPIIQQKNITIEVDAAWATASVDEDQIQIVVRNILHNAIKFSPLGGTIRVALSADLNWGLHW